MTFSIGDTVRIITKEFENNASAPHFGKTGIVTAISNWSGQPPLFSVARQDDTNIPYYAEHLELVYPTTMADPDMTLDEIHAAQDLVNR